MGRSSTSARNAKRRKILERKEGELKGGEKQGAEIDAFFRADALGTRIVRFILKTGLSAAGRRVYTGAVAVYIRTERSWFFKYANAYFVYASLPLVIKQNPVIRCGLLYGSKGKKENGSSECLFDGQEATQRCCFIYIIICKNACKCWR